MNMRATVLKPAGAPEVTGDSHWQYVQNPDSGAIEKFWVLDDVETADVYEGVASLKDVPVVARGVLNAGIRGAGTTEVFDDIYTNIDWVKMQFPAGYNITARDQVTDIRDSEGNLVWSRLDGAPEVFNVMGITPVINAFGRAVEYTALMKRAEVQP